MIRLYAAPDGALTFWKDEAAERRAWAELVARRRAAEERMHVRHMAALGVTDDPTRSLTREVLFDAGDPEEEALWNAWRRYAGF